MASVKADAIRLIEALPDDCTWGDVVYRMYVNAKIARGLADADAGRLIPHEQVMRESEEWLASLGRPMPVGSTSEPSEE
jgi:predicted transcriptional regulator